MGKVTEPLDSLTGRIALGIHLVATAVLCSANASREEIALAGEILKRDPPRSLPRELAGAIETFNRHMDAAIDSANASAGCATRAERRAQLASALDRAGLVMIEQSTLAELLSRKLAAGADPLEDEDPFDDGDAVANGGRVWTDGDGNLSKINTRPGGLNYVELEDDDFITVYGGPIGGSLADAVAFDAILTDAVSGLGVGLVDGHGGVTHVPIGDFLESDARAVADHRVND